MIRDTRAPDGTAALKLVSIDSIISEVKRE